MSDYEIAHEYEAINYYRRGGAAKIELNRPDRLNAWNERLSLDLLAALTAAAVMATVTIEVKRSPIVTSLVSWTWPLFVNRRPGLRERLLRGEAHA